MNFSLSGVVSLGCQLQLCPSFSKDIEKTISLPDDLQNALRRTDTREETTIQVLKINHDWKKKNMVGLGIFWLLLYALLRPERLLEITFPCLC